MPSKANFQSSEANDLIINSIADFIPGGLVILDKEGKIIRVNTRFVEITGFSPEGLSFEEYATKIAKARKIDDDPYLYEQLPLAKALFKGMATCNQEIVFQRSDTLQRVILVNARPIKNQDGKIIGAVSVMEDITERKKAEEELAKVASFPLINPNPILETDFDGNITFANPAAKTQFNETIHPSILAIMKATIQSLKQGKTKTCEIQVNKKWFFGQFYLVPDGKHVRAYFIDITKKKKAEEELRLHTTLLEQAKKELEKYSSQMEQLAEQRLTQLRNQERLVAIGKTAGMVGHDIRNPLQAIVADLYIAKEEIKIMPEGDKKRSMQETINGIEENVFYINKIVSDLQDYTRPIAPTFTEVNAKELIDNIVSLIKIPHSIQAYVAVTKDLVIKTDADYLRRVLTNLVINAVQAMPNEGSLIIQVCRRKNTIRITVEDTGVGIPEDVREKLFTPLFTTKSKGQGLGLAVVKRLVTGLGGSINVDSEQGKGTKFVIELPA